MSAREIEVVAWFDKEGTIHPVRFRIESENGEMHVVKIDKVYCSTFEKCVDLIAFDCSSIVNGVNKRYKLKYDTNSCKWILF